MTNWGKKVRMKLMPNVYNEHICSLKTKIVKNWFNAKNVRSGHTVCANNRERVLYVTGVRNDKHLLLKTLFCNINKYNFLFMASLNCFRALNVINPPVPHNYSHPILGVYLCSFVKLVLSL